MAQVSKAQAGYHTDGKLNRHCGPAFRPDDKNYCRFFIPSTGAGRFGRCEKVEGVIDAEAGCNLYQRVK